MERWGFRIVFSTFLTLCVSIVGLADNPPKFIENKGQLPENVEFKLRVANADLYFEKDRLTFSFYAPELLHTDHHQQLSANAKLGGHAYQMVFGGADGDAKVKPTGRMFPDYSNYITAKYQVGHVRSYDRIRYQNIYQGIDLEYFGRGGHLKYDVIIAPEADIDQLQMQYEGANSIHLKNGRLVIENTYNTVEESIPLAYQIVNGKKIQVACRYKLRGNTVSFVFPDGYDSQHELVIDPTLVFASYSGSTSDNFGFTATYDDAGALYGGGFAYGLGYPYVTGSYAATFGGVRDMTISKFTPDGTGLEYSTYIGGDDMDAPHSMVVNSQGELVILGTTGSSNFPTTPNAFDNTFGGGTYAQYVYNGAEYSNGSDISVTVLSADGSSLVGSTYLGGSLNDGLNQNATLRYNYNDVFRGEVIVDADDNIYVAMTTESSDFPVTTGAFGQSLNGTQDACLAKFNPDLSVLEWCTCLGGSGADAGYSLKISSTDDVYLTGGTTSQDFPIAGTALNATYQGGSADGFVAHVSADGSGLLYSSYIGTSLYDQSFFVEVDNDGDVYLYGQTTGSYPVSSGVYSNNNGKQFIQKITPDLSTSIYSTVFGSGSSTINLSPTAFLVDICERVYISGWGGAVNATPYANAGGNTFNMPTTSDAVQQTTDGSDFYFLVLETDASSLLYATYYGGASEEHVDGGTSRFDPNGVIYQAVCAACGAANDFPTTPGVWSETDQSGTNECNLGVIKLAMELSTVDVQISSGLNVTGCAPLEVQFESTITNASDFMWYFDNGDSSDLANPVFTYDTPGVYEVLLVGSGVISCTGTPFTDTAVATITVGQLTDAADAGNGASLCPGDSAMIGSDAVSGYSYSWSPTSTLSDSTVAQPYASPTEETWYHLTITNQEGCEDSDSVLVSVFGIDVYPDTTLCNGDSVMITVVGGTEFLWSPTVGVSDSTSSNPYIVAGFAEMYTVTASDGACQDTAVVHISSVPSPSADFDVAISQSCLGDSVSFVAMQDGADAYHWNIDGYETDEPNPTLFLEPNNGPLVTLTVTTENGACSDSLTVDYSNGWFTDDSLAVKYPNVFTPNGDGYNDCFKPDFLGNLDDCYTLKVFSRWGRLLYDSEKMGGNCWDGKQRTDGMVKEGTYYYIANVRGMDHAGFVTVLYPK
ncbi:MAG: T9SS type B sorting domain-containing protein [Flavobacteriales bacterium]|nr:T9SS type B sorting domain-containing protein [Flavobacteriales bacterium]